MKQTRDLSCSEEDASVIFFLSINSDKNKEDRSAVLTQQQWNLLYFSLQPLSEKWIHAVPLSSHYILCHKNKFLIRHVPCWGMVEWLRTRACCGL